MREIKFRGRRKNSSEWVYGAFLAIPQLCSYIYDVQPDGQATRYLVDEETVGQFTGLTDANGQEIYEGDVVAFSDYDGTTHKGKVYFRDGAFFVTQPDMEYGYRLYVLVKLYYPVFVIGNVHDNPELLEVEA